jgi:hypothetical protein
VKRTPKNAGEHPGKTPEKFGFLNQKFFGVTPRRSSAFFGVQLLDQLVPE